MGANPVLFSDETFINTDVTQKNQWGQDPNEVHLRTSTYRRLGRLAKTVNVYSFDSVSTILDGSQCRLISPSRPWSWVQTTEGQIVRKEVRYIRDSSYTVESNTLYYLKFKYCSFRRFPDPSEDFPTPSGPWTGQNKLLGVGISSKTLSGPLGTLHDLSRDPTLDQVKTTSVRYTRIRSGKGRDHEVNDLRFTPKPGSRKGRGYEVPGQDCLSGLELHLSEGTRPRTISILFPCVRVGPVRRKDFTRGTQETSTKQMSLVLVLFTSVVGLEVHVRVDERSGDDTKPQTHDLDGTQGVSIMGVSSDPGPGIVDTVPVPTSLVNG